MIKNIKFIFFQNNYKIFKNYLILLIFTTFFASCTSTTKQGFIIPQNWQKPSKAYRFIDVQYTREQMDGVSSWYGPNFHGKKTANGETYNQNGFTVAHRILPMNTIIKITNLENGKRVISRVNDRGPYKKNRILDVTKKIAKELGFLNKGTARVKLDIIAYPKSYNPKLGIKPYKQKVVQLIAYKNKNNAIKNARKIKNNLQPIPIFLDQPQKGEFHIVSGPFNSDKKANLVASYIKKKGYQSFIRSFRK